MALMFKPEVTFGNLMSLLSIVVAGTVGYSQLRAEQKAQRDTSTRMESQIAETRADAVIREARIRALELGAGRNEEKLLNIIASLSRIEAQLNRRNGP